MSDLQELKDLDLNSEEIDLEKLMLEAVDYPSFILELLNFSKEHNPQQLKHIINKYKNNSELIDVKDIDYDKIKNI